MGFILKIVTPEGLFFEGNVDSLNLKLTKGYTGILPHHMPLVSMIEPSCLTYKQGNIVREMAISGGVLNVRDENTMILANSIEYKENIDINRAHDAEKRARERLNNKKESIDIQRAQAALQRSLVRIQVYEKK